MTPSAEQLRGFPLTIRIGKAAAIAQKGALKNSAALLRRHATCSERLRLGLSGRRKTQASGAGGETRAFVLSGSDCLDEPLSAPNRWRAPRNVRKMLRHVQGKRTGA